MGTAHPRRMGIACHLGLWLERPTIGCGKTRLVGHYGSLSEEKGAYVPLIDRGETIGTVVRTRTGTHPMFISPGHKADLPTSISLVLACCLKYRIPEPIRLAHKAAGAF
jgi:deoxyribonuclease V